MKLVQKQTDGAWTLGPVHTVDGKVVDRSSTSAEYGLAMVTG